MVRLPLMRSLPFPSNCTQLSSKNFEMMDLGMTNADGSKKLIKVQREATTDESITVSRVHRTEIDHPRVRHPVVAEKHLRAHMGGDLTTYFDKPKNIHAETWSLIESGDHEKALKLHTAHHEGDHAQVRTIKGTIRRHHTRHSRAKVDAAAKTKADMAKKSPWRKSTKKKEMPKEHKFVKHSSAATDDEVGDYVDDPDCDELDKRAIPTGIIPDLFPEEGIVDDTWNKAKIKASSFYKSCNALNVFKDSCSEHVNKTLCVLKKQDGPSCEKCKALSFCKATYNRKSAGYNSCTCKLDEFEAHAVVANMTKQYKDSRMTDCKAHKLAIEVSLCVCMCV